MHLAALRSDRHENSYLQRSFNKHGEESFEIFIIMKGENLTREELLNLEKLFIKLFDTMNREKGYNLTLGGLGSLGWKMPKKERQRRSLMYSGEGNPFFGKTHSKETMKRKVANTDYSYTQTKEFRKKMSEATKGRQFTAEHSKNKSMAQMGGKNPNARRVSIEGRVYECIQDAVDELSVKHSTIHYRLNAKSKRFKDWFYID